MLTKVNYKERIKLLNKYKYNPKLIYNLRKKDLIEIKGIGNKTSEIILSESIKKSANEKIKIMIKNKINIISIKDKRYPSKLKEIYDPPICLYVKGNYKILNNKSIAIIGCRDSSKYGENASNYFGASLSEIGINIVSGLARGIDSYSHIGNINLINTSDKKILKFLGKPIAVVGNGLDIIYPYENIILEEKIIQNGGCIISEYPIGTKPEKMNFPARNRIISGLADGVLVIEAKSKSGTLITVDFALDQGRDVYAIPGNINSKNSIGTNNLIKDGAIPVTNINDFL